MSTEAKKLSNRATQRTHATYKSKAEISEALHLIQPYINKSTYKFLSHYLYTNGTGSTQIKVTEQCKKAEISTGSYSKTVKYEIENTFSQPLVIITEAPMKYDKKRQKKVKASPFKSLLPLSVIKHLVKAKRLEEQTLQDEYWDEIENMPIPIGENTVDNFVHAPSQENFNTPINSEVIEAVLGESDIESDIKGDIEGDIESNLANPTESKDEGTFLQQQNKSFRENLLEKSIKTLNNKSIKQNEPKKYFIKKEVKNILNQIPGLHENQKQEFANRIQIALKRTGADIESEELQDCILDTCQTFIEHYEKHPDEIQGDYYGLLYVCIENKIWDFLHEQELGKRLEEEVESYDDWEEVNNQREIYKEYRLAMTETCATKDELDELGIY